MSSAKILWGALSREGVGGGGGGGYFRANDKFRKLYWVNSLLMVEKDILRDLFENYSSKRNENYIVWRDF